MERSLQRKMLWKLRVALRLKLHVSQVVLGNGRGAFLVNKFILKLDTIQITKVSLERFEVGIYT